MRHRTAPVALLATLTLFGFGLGCGENAAEGVPEARTAPARPVDPPAVEEAAAAPVPAAPTDARVTPATGKAVPAGTEIVRFSDENGSTVKFVGSKILGGSHDGGFKVFEGDLTLDSGTEEVARIEANIDMTSTWSDNEKLTNHLKNADFFDVEKHPKATFVTTEIKPGGKDGASHTIVGNLTLHGVTKSIEFPATLTVNDDEAKIVSEFFIKRADFEINYSPAVIRDEVVIKLDVKAPRSKPEG